MMNASTTKELTMKVIAAVRVRGRLAMSQGRSRLAG